MGQPHLECRLSRIRCTRFVDAAVGVEHEERAQPDAEFFFGEAAFGEGDVHRMEFDVIRAMSGRGPTYSHFTFFRYRYSAKHVVATIPISTQ